MGSESASASIDGTKSLNASSGRMTGISNDGMYVVKTVRESSPQSTPTL